MMRWILIRYKLIMVLFFVAVVVESQDSWSKIYLIWKMTILNIRHVNESALWQRIYLFNKINMHYHDQFVHSHKFNPCVNTDKKKMQNNRMSNIFYKKRKRKLLKWRNFFFFFAFLLRLCTLFFLFLFEMILLCCVRLFFSVNLTI